MGPLEPPAAAPVFPTLEVLHRRSSVRSFRYRTLDDSVISRLIDAAVCAPSAFDEQPWSFVVVEDRVLLRRISEVAKELWRAEPHPRPPHAAAGLPARDPLAEGMWKPDFDLLYGAPALLVIGTRSQSEFADADCWLAAENLLIAATALGLGGCVVASVLGSLRTPEIRGLLNTPAAYRPVVPIVVGVPKEAARPRARRAAEILAWRK